MIENLEEALLALLGASKNETMNYLRIYVCMIWLAKAKAVRPFRTKELHEALDHLIELGFVKVISDV